MEYTHINLNVKPPANPVTADKLCKLASMFASPFDGEVANAARAFLKAIQSSGYVPEDYIQVPAAVPHWQVMALELYEIRFKLKAKECSLVTNLLHGDKEPTQAQQEWLGDIFKRVKKHV